MSSPKILSLDIETAPLEVWTWGMRDQYISPEQVKYDSYMLCWAAKWFNEKDVMWDALINYPKYYKKYPRDSLKITQSIWELVDQADIIVGQNSDNFDLKWLNTCFLKHNLKPPSSYKTVDTYKVAKKYFRFASNKMDFQLRVTGLGAKIEHEGFHMWRKCMEGNKSAWKKMIEYNKHDVVEVEKLYKTVRPYITNHPNMGIYVGNGKIVCTNCSSTDVKKCGFKYLATNTYQRYRCKKCGREMRGRKPVEKSTLQVVST